MQNKAIVLIQTALFPGLSRLETDYESLGFDGTGVL
jgi:hypothetical protein